MNKGIRVVTLSFLIITIAATSNAASLLGLKERKYYKTCKEEITKQLKAPSTAKFPSYSKDMITEVTDSIKFHFFVDSQNTYGAMIRTDCECTVWKSGPRAGELSAHIPEAK